MKKSVLAFSFLPLLGIAFVPVIGKASVPAVTVERSPELSVPIPGTEAWLAEYAEFGPGDADTAKRCALEALGSGFTEEIDAWAAAGDWTLSSFASRFGLESSAAYLNCAV